MQKIKQNIVGVFGNVPSELEKPLQWTKSGQSASASNARIVEVIKLGIRNIPICQVTGMHIASSHYANTFTQKKHSHRHKR